jgi:NADPH2:quinone reductase
MKAIRIHQRGAPEVMCLEEIDTPTPQEGQVLIQVAVAGVNYADVGQRKGTYPNLVALPTTLGSEVAGTVVACGPGVTAPPVGARVVSLVEGGYAEYAVAEAKRVIPLPEGISFAQATPIPIQGQTAYLLLEKAARLRPGERILIHAASGGVGSLAAQLASHFGAGAIIGTANTPEKLEFIRALGVHAAINTDEADWVEQVMHATQGQGVHVILDSIGGSTAQQSLACLAPFGRMVVFGSLSDAPTPMIAQMLIPRCQAIIGYNTVIQPLEDQMRVSQDLLRLMASGQVRVMLDRSFSLADAPAAHRAIEGNTTLGKVVLTL